MPGQETFRGGQQQRVAIARALVRKPELVLADEPTASLDGASGREIVELLRQLARAQGCTIMLVTHDNRILDLADRSLRLEDGVLSSYASALTSDSAHMLTALSAFRESEELAWFWSNMDTGQFLDALRKLRVEAMQFLNVMDFGAGDSLVGWVDSLLQSVLGKIAQILECGSRQHSHRRRDAVSRGCHQHRFAAGDRAAHDGDPRSGWRFDWRGGVPGQCHRGGIHGSQRAPSPGLRQGVRPAAGDVHANEKELENPCHNTDLGFFDLVVILATWHLRSSHRSNE